MFCPRTFTSRLNITALQSRLAGRLKAAHGPWVPHPRCRVNETVYIQLVHSPVYNRLVHTIGSFIWFVRSSGFYRSNWYPAGPHRCFILVRFIPLFIFYWFTPLVPPTVSPHRFILVRRTDSSLFSSKQEPRRWPLLHSYSTNQNRPRVINATFRRREIEFPSASPEAVTQARNEKLTAETDKSRDHVSSGFSAEETAEGCLRRCNAASITAWASTIRTNERTKRPIWRRNSPG